MTADKELQEIVLLHTAADAAASRGFRGLHDAIEELLAPLLEAKQKDMTETKHTKDGKK